MIHLERPRTGAIESDMSSPMENFTHISLEVEGDLDTWEVAEERPPGSRVKRTLIRDGAHFIFKYPKSQREHQIWSELLGSFIAGDLLGWDVQHVSLGIHKGSPGNLLRYIYQADAEDKEQFIEGWQLCKEVDPEFDVDEGQRHTFPLLLRVYDQVISQRYGISRIDFMEFWSRAFVLDTLISNTDRHAENWAIIVSPSGDRMAPFYDNGSSMGCEYEDRGLNKCFGQDGQIKPAWISHFRDHGKHHVRLDQPARHGAFFKPLCYKLLDEYPEGRAAFEHAANIDLEAVGVLTHDIIRRIKLPEGHALTERRAAHIQGISNNTHLPTWFRITETR